MPDLPDQLRTAVTMTEPLVQAVRPEQWAAPGLGTLSQLPAGRSPFAPSQPVPADAPAIDRLAGLLGRPVGWR